jgi:glycosyltransferase involved in cell wall biosynthesis
MFIRTINQYQDMKKQIVLDCERMKYLNTGIFHYCLNLGKHLLEQVDPDSEMLNFFTPSQSDFFGTSKNYISQHSAHKFLMPSLGNYDIWHATYQNTDYMPRRNKRIKVVLTIHDLNFIHDDLKPEAKKQKYLRHLQHNIDRSDVIICISEFSRNDVMKYCDTGNKPVHIIHNGTNTLIKPTLSENSYQPSKRFVFSIGVLTRKKNFHALLPLLMNNDMELLIAGRNDDQSYLNYLLNMAKELGVENNVKVLGNISEHEKSWYFRNCYAFASTSMAEGFCLPVTEAMSVGKPLFLSSQTALPEIGGKVAFYFSDFNETNMQNVFLNGMDQYKTTNMHKEIMERGSSFSWKKTAERYMEIYRSI